MDSRLSGINESSYQELVISIMDYADRINEIFNRIDDNVSQISDCYKSDSCQLLLLKYEEIKKCYPIIHENILSYSADLTVALQKYNEMILDAASKFDILTHYTTTKAKEIETL